MLEHFRYFLQNKMDSWYSRRLAIICYSPAALDGESHMELGGPMGPRSGLFLRKYFSILARMCLP